MSLPNKRKLDINIKSVDPSGAPSHWVTQFLDQNKTFLPRSVDHADLDSAFVEFVDKDLEVVFEGQKVPSVFLTLQRWTEFTRTWKFTDKYENVKIPFISIVRKPDAQPGTNPIDYKIPIRKTFPYMKVPVWNGNTNGMDIYEIPNPVGVDLTYTVRFFTYKMRQLNKLNQKVLQTFSSAQAYINIKGHYFPIMLESIGDESTVENLEGKRFYVQTYEMKMLGYLVDEEEFKIKPAIERIFLTQEVCEKKPKAVIKIIKENNVVTGTTNINQVSLISQFLPGSPTYVNINIDNAYNFEDLVLNNILTYEFRLNDNIVTLPFSTVDGDTLVIDIVRTNSTDFSELILNGNV